MGSRRRNRLATLNPARPNMVRARLCVAVALTGFFVAAHAAPRAEVQVALCEPLDDLSRKLRLTPREAPYETWHFDDARLVLLGRSVRIRLRDRPHGAELTVKAATQDCATASIQKRHGKCEYDVYGGKTQGAVSLSRKLDARQSRSLVAATQPLAALLSTAQAQYLRDVVGLWPLPGDLRPLGPIANAVYADGRGYDIDVNTLPDGKRYIEIGIKVALPDAASAQRDLDAYLASAGVTVCADQRGQAADKLRRLAAP